jgi:hypothetical protein
MKKLQLILISLMVLASCNNVKEKTKETLNEGGEIVGKTATEIVEGIKEGVDKTLECDIQLSQELKDKGIKTGKYTIENDSLGGKNNILVLYLIFEKDFNKAITVKAMDKNGLETGRSKISITAKAGNAGYFDFKFDKRTYIEVKSKIEVE